VCIATAASVLLLNPGVTALRALPGGHVPSEDRILYAGLSPAEWDEVAPRLRTLSEDVDVVVTSNSLQMLYHVGAYDYAVRPTVVSELVPPEQFSVDRRTGRPAVSTLASIQRIVTEHERGLIVGERWRWDHPFEGLTPDVAEWVRTHLVEVTGLPRKLTAYRWGA
jgi:hypothetical protein